MKPEGYSEEDRGYAGPWAAWTKPNAWCAEREWLSTEKLRYYLHKWEGGHHDGQWIVINAYYDTTVGKFYSRKQDCIRAWIKMQS